MPFATGSAIFNSLGCHRKRAPVHRCTYNHKYAPNVAKYILRRLLLQRTDLFAPQRNTGMMFVFFVLLPMGQTTSCCFIAIIYSHLWAAFSVAFLAIVVCWLCLILVNALLAVVACDSFIIAALRVNNVAAQSIAMLLSWLQALLRCNKRNRATFCVAATGNSNGNRQQQRQQVKLNLLSLNKLFHVAV